MTKKASVAEAPWPGGQEPQRLPTRLQEPPFLGPASLLVFLAKKSRVVP